MKFKRFPWMDVGLVLATFLLLPGLAYADEDAKPGYEVDFEAGNWGTEVTFGVNLLQSYYTKNWNGGDKSSVVWNSTLDVLAKKKLNDDFHWTNTLNLAFGQNHQQYLDEQEKLVWRKPDKSTDAIKYESLLRYMKTQLDPFFSVRFESQFLDQNDPLKDFTFNPIVFAESAGISRMLVKDDGRELLARLGFTVHQNVRDIYLFDRTASPVLDEVVTQTTMDGGAELIFDYKDNFFEDRIGYTGQLSFYQPFFFSAKSDFESLGAAKLTAAGLDPGLADDTVAIDIDFVNTFQANITNVINVQLNLRWVYDSYDNTMGAVIENGDLQNVRAVQAAVRKAGQFKQNMSIGLAYKF